MTKGKKFGSVFGMVMTEKYCLNRFVDRRAVYERPCGLVGVLCLCAKARSCTVDNANSRLQRKRLVMNTTSHVVHDVIFEA